MQEERAENINESVPGAGSAAVESKREVSSIQFPYGDLDDAVDFAKGVHAVGGQSCLIEQLAGHLRVAANGGAFRARLAYPRIFGLCEYERGSVTLTPLGLRIVDPSQEEAARVDAFLTVPLYRAVYEKYKGYTLPPPAALEREMAGLGVSSKQTDKARQVFDRSAKQAGFYWAGTERLTLPVVKSKPDTRPIEPPSTTTHVGSGAGNGGDDDLALDPLLVELLKKIPSTGEQWPAAQRVRWFRTFAMNVSQIYDDDSSPVDLKITVESVSQTGQS
ncbi:hypothetical protein RZS28_04685 [Methylocapsa polymorpha]|uniref:Uncharacterized protein n=1 Tax=Methylocapsa polymorpha TaxID=3080828 RepID=A0ABZ0HTH7_9HYPH|nr:hypothetical protein RZS28_04685 [Methylocapsa sp. RX1]